MVTSPMGSMPSMGTTSAISCTRSPESPSRGRVMPDMAERRAQPAAMEGSKEYGIRIIENGVRNIENNKRYGKE